MANAINDILFALISRAVCGTELKDSVKEQITPDALKELYSISKLQDISHILAEALISENLLPHGEIRDAYTKQKMTAVFRYANIRHDLSEICTALNEAKIRYMLLKGSVIRKYYQKPELRTSCDIDIFIDKSDLADAQRVFEDRLSYTFSGRTAHDISCFSPGRTHVELHFDLIENDGRVKDALSHVLEESLPDGESEYRRVMNNEVFLLYHIAHMAKHFLGGGCGIRPFIDLWVIKNKMGYDEKKAFELFHSCGLDVFAKTVMHLSDIWFDGADHNDLTRKVEDFILGATIYGCAENRVAISQLKRGGKIRYILRRIFLPYNKLSKIYPTLQKYPILLPFYEIKRWWRLVFEKRTPRALHEFKASLTVADEKKAQLFDMFESLGLR